MIFFDGKALESVAPVKIEDIRVSPIQMTAAARQRPVRWGADFVRMTGGSRTVDIVFALLTNNRDTRQAQLKAITAWARSDQPKKLELPNHGNLYLEAICTALPEPSLRQWWESRLRLVFTTFDNPFWTSAIERSAPCGQAFTVLGDAPPIMRIEHTYESAATDQAWTDGEDEFTLNNVPAGKLVIDLNRQTVAHNDVSLMDEWEFESTFIRPRTGTRTITGVGTIYWRERWQ